MEYRNSGNATHYGKGLVTDVDAVTGIEHSGSTITAASDSAAANLTVRAKGTGTLTLGDSSNVVNINGSTTAFKLVTGESTYTPPALAANAQGYCTFAAAGLSTGDLILTTDFRDGLSTVYLVGNAFCGEAGKIHVQVGNVHGSTISGSTTGIVRWAYIDRT